MFGVLGDLESILNNRFAEFYARKEAPGQKHLFDESQVERDSLGQFAEKGEGEESEPKAESKSEPQSESPAASGPAREAHKEYSRLVSQAGLVPRGFEEWDQSRKETLAKQAEQKKSADEAWKRPVGDYENGGLIPAEMYDGLETPSGFTLKVKRRDDGKYDVWTESPTGGKLPQKTGGNSDEARNAAWRAHGGDPKSWQLVDAHRRIVRKAIDAGEPVPESVLADYPDLRPKSDATLAARYDEYTQAMKSAKIEPRPFSEWKAGLKPAAHEPAHKVNGKPEITQQVKESRPATPETDNAKGKEKPTAHSKTAAKLRDLAASMTDAADSDLSRDRLSNTRKRAEQAGHAVADAMSRQAFANTLNNLADHLESGQANHIAGIRNKAQVEALDSALQRGRFKFTRNSKVGMRERERIEGEPFTEEHVSAAEYPFPFLRPGLVKEALAAIKGKPGSAKITEALGRHAYGDDGQRITDAKKIEALDGLIGMAERHGLRKYDLAMLKDARADYNRLQSAAITPENFHSALNEYRQLKSYGEREPAWKKLERGLVGRKIPGFFPTPKPVISKMLDKADIQPGMNVLEPSAGKGDILDALKSRHPEAKAHALEISGDLRAIVEGKGHKVETGDFLEHGEKYDRIVMNPPFENHQDIDHTRHAFDLLKPGGRLVSVMSSGPFQREQAKDRDFRQWFEDHGGQMEKLPQGAFAGSDAFRQTGVSTVLVTLDKPD